MILAENILHPFSTQELIERSSYQRRRVDNVLLPNSPKFFFQHLSSFNIFSITLKNRGISIFSLLLFS